MRIIGGTARGRTLVAPPGFSTRPTQDAVRESLFNILRNQVPEARVLDLFAGSGALALESLSRGAANAVLVDNARQAMRIIQRNVAHAGFTEQCICLCCDWQAALTRLRGQGQQFDLVFVDPPYDRVEVSPVCAALAGLLAEEGLVVAEHRTGAPPVVRLPLRQVDTRRYGDTTITMIRKEGTDAHSHLSGQL